MAKFIVYAKEVVVGHSLLESGDPPMGVATGVFVPSEAYSQIQSRCVGNLDDRPDQSVLGLSVRTESGMVVPCIALTLLDYSAVLGKPYIELDVIGIPYPLYGELFPEQRAAYDRQFRSPEKSSD